MSFILDALKKSEDERQRQNGPSLADIRIHRRRQERPWWVIAVVVLLAINLGVLVVVLTRNSGGQSILSPAPAAQDMQDARPAGSISTAPVSPARPATGRANAVRSLAEEADPYGGEFYDPDSPVGTPYPLDGFDGFDDSAYTHSEATAIQGRSVHRIEGPAVAPSYRAPQSGSRLGSSFAQNPHQNPQADGPMDNQMNNQEIGEILPTFSDIIAGGTPLPDMHLDIHVYSGTPAERFVFVNMRKYIEGQSLGEGPQVERITPDGVILNHRGQRFLLPRQ